jgi:hypothetical protein
LGLSGLRSAQKCILTIKQTDHGATNTNLVPGSEQLPTNPGIAQPGSVGRIKVDHKQFVTEALDTAMLPRGQWILNRYFAINRTTDYYAVSINRYFTLDAIAFDCQLEGGNHSSD